MVKRVEKQGETFALKLISKKHTPKPRFDKEVSILRAIGRHLNIVGLVEAFEGREDYGLVLELATGNHSRFRG